VTEHVRTYAEQFVPEKNVLRIRDPTPENRGEHEYAFDNIFGVETSQEELFEKVFDWVGIDSVGNSCFILGNLGWSFAV
jgi:hypothetical protein